VCQQSNETDTIVFMAAKHGSDRTHGCTCSGFTKDGKPCTSYVKEDGNGYCHWHQAQAPGMNVVKLSSRTPLQPPADIETREQRMAWLDAVRRGEIEEEKPDPRGGTNTVPCSMKDRLTACKMLEDMEQADGKSAEGASKEQLRRDLAEMLGLG
jgi:hypothetical protein